MNLQKLPKILIIIGVVALVIAFYLERKKVIDLENELNDIEPEEEEEENDQGDKPEPGPEPGTRKTKKEKIEPVKLPDNETGEQKQ